MHICFYLLTFQGNEKLTELMLINGADVDGGFETTGRTPLMYAAENGV